MTQHTQAFQKAYRAGPATYYQLPITTQAGKQWLQAQGAEL
ncbi:hypothetical protein ACU6RQ_10690 [Zobellella denitrificans]